jgi:hypothetical protein
MHLLTMPRHPSAFLPVAMSIGAFATVVVFVAVMPPVFLLPW